MTTHIFLSVFLFILVQSYTILVIVQLVIVTTHNYFLLFGSTRGVSHLATLLLVPAGGQPNDLCVRGQGAVQVLVLRKTEFIFFPPCRNTSRKNGVKHFLRITVFIRLIAARIIRIRLKKSGCASLFGCVYY